jgi:hypothetical protein
MKNKLHIIGCSHSTDYDCELDKWWGKFLADSLQLDLFHTHGQSGKNVEFILLDIYDRMLNGKISKDDVVVFNTSYPLRFGSPRLQQFSTADGPSDIPTEELQKQLELSRDGHGYTNFSFVNEIETFNENQLDDILTYDLWYRQTYAAGQLLNSVCNNVYQWTLIDNIELDKIYESGLEQIQINDRNKANVYNMSNYPSWINDDNFKDVNKNEWKGLITQPSELKDWEEYILKRPRSKNSHMNPSRHKGFSEIFHKQIWNDLVKCC